MNGGNTRIVYFGDATRETRQRRNIPVILDNIVIVGVPWW